MLFWLRGMIIFAAGCCFLAACGSVQTKGASGSRSDAAATAKRYLGTPYRYGGSDPRGFDCSGFVVYVFRQHGVELPHNAADQFARLRSVRNPEAGDLVFFNTFGRDVSHVGIYTAKDTFIHSPREGKTVEYADMRLDYWRAAYRGARRAL